MKFSPIHVLRSVPDPITLIIFGENYHEEAQDAIFSGTLLFLPSTAAA